MDPDVVHRVQKLMTEEFEANGLLMSEDDPAKLERKLLGVVLKGDKMRFGLLQNSLGK